MSKIHINSEIKETLVQVDRLLDSGIEGGELELIELDSAETAMHVVPVNIVEGKENGENCKRDLFGMQIPAD